METLRSLKVEIKGPKKCNLTALDYISVTKEEFGMWTLIRAIEDDPVAQRTLCVKITEGTGITMLFVSDEAALNKSTKYYCLEHSQTSDLNIPLKLTKPLYVMFSAQSPFVLTYNKRHKVERTGFLTSFLAPWCISETQFFTEIVKHKQINFVTNMGGEQLYLLSNNTEDKTQSFTAITGFTGKIKRI